MYKFAHIGMSPTLKFGVIIINERATLTDETRYSETAPRLDLSRGIFLQRKHQETLTL